MALKDGWKSDKLAGRDLDCPCAGDDPKGWCDYRNAALWRAGRRDIEWAVGAGDVPCIRHNAEWSRGNARVMEQAREAERVRFMERTG